MENSSIENSTGAMRVKAEFNPAKNETVDQIKNASAELINQLDNVKWFKTLLNESNEKLKALLKAESEKEGNSDERMRQLTLSARATLQVDGLANALEQHGDSLQTEVETACMYAVKACFTK